MGVLKTYQVDNEDSIFIFCFCLREGFKKKKKCGIFRTFQNPPTPLAKCGKKIKITLAKNYFFPLKKSKILRKISRSGRSSSHLDLRNILSVRPQPPYEKNKLLLNEYLGDTTA